MVFDHLVDAEQIERAPGEGDGVGDAALENLARLRGGGLDVRAAEPVTSSAIVLCAGRTFTPRRSSGMTIFLRAE